MCRSRVELGDCNPFFFIFLFKMIKGGIYLYGDNQMGNFSPCKVKTRLGPDLQWLRKVAKIKD